MPASSSFMRSAAVALAVLGSGARANGDAAAAAAAAAAAEAQVSQLAAHPATPAGAVFFTNFDDSAPEFQLSNFKDYEGQNVKVRVADESAFDDDKSLFLENDATRYGVYMPVDDPDAAEGDLVVQYEVRLSKGLECGGAYLKLLDAGDLPADGNVTPDSPYIVMFGPDKCGDTNKVHFILRHQNPVSKEWEEKHFKSDTPLQIQNDRSPHLYTLIVRQDNTFTIKIDNKVQKNGHLLENLEPAINPPAEIDDPDDKKPSDWVDDAKIPDPTASKPDDWDEDAPKTILDEEAVMPEGWLEDEKYLIPDPTAEQPDEWDEEDDGEWEAPQVQNPKCASAPGCEKWQRPVIANPAYKGKWSAPLIDNEAYIGEWAPRRIENPNFFVDNEPGKDLVKSIGGVAVEVWVFKNGGIGFDNVLVATDEDAASLLATTSFLVKADRERSSAADRARRERHEQNLKLLESGGILGTVQYYLYESLDFAREWPIATAGAGLLVLVGLIYLCCATCCAADGGDEDDDFVGETAAAASADAAGDDADGDNNDDNNDEGDDEVDDDDDDDDDDDAPPLVSKPASNKKND